MDNEILENAEIIWNYHRLHHDVFEDHYAKEIDGILVFGSSDISVADAAANLWLILLRHRLKDNKAPPYMIISGGLGTSPHSGYNLMGWKKPEAEIFSDRVLSILKNRDNCEHYQKLRIFVESEAKNSGENVDLSRHIIMENNLKYERLVIVHKPFMERRAYATFKYRWPNPDVRLYSSKIGLGEYPTISKIPLKEVIGMMLGYLQRIKLYAPPHGHFQIYQEIPIAVWTAFEKLTEEENITAEYPEFKASLIDVESNITNQISKSAEIIWNYHRLHHDVFEDGYANQTDGILVFGSSDISVADEAANLWMLLLNQRWKDKLTLPYMIFSGGLGTGPHSGYNLMGWEKPEAEIFSERVLSIIKKRANPEQHDKIRIFVETKAKNSGDNVDLSRKIIVDNNLACKKLIIVQKPFMERRTYATFKKRWSDPEIRLYSSKIGLQEYPKISNISLKEVIGIMLGDMQRIKMYAPPHGNFQISQDIPDDVWTAFKLLTEDDAIFEHFPEFQLNLIKRHSKQICKSSE